MLLYFIDIRSDCSSAQNKLNVNAPEFTVKTVQNTQPVGFFSSPNTYLQHSKSSGNIQHQIQLAVARQIANINSPRTILVSQPIQLQQAGYGVAQPTVDSSPTTTIQMNVGALCFLHNSIHTLLQINKFLFF